MLLKFILKTYGFFEIKVIFSPGEKPIKFKWLNNKKMYNHILFLKIRITIIRSKSRCRFLIVYVKKSKLWRSMCIYIYLVKQVHLDTHVINSFGKKVTFNSSTGLSIILAVTVKNHHSFTAAVVSDIWAENFTGYVSFKKLKISTIRTFITRSLTMRTLKRTLHI